MVYTAEQLITELENQTPEVVIKLAWKRFGNKLVFATSLGVEDQLITDMIVRNDLPIAFVTLDTGRLFSETYDLITETERHYGIKIRVFVPEREAVEKLVTEQGINGFSDSVENRKRCCRVRKIEPLRRALAPYSAWLCGLRREQSVTRGSVRVAENDAANGVVKVSPLAAWTEQEVWEAIAARRIPYHPLHDKGYRSIGCACCTRAVEKNSDVRSGRWWWEEPEHKECGLHSRASQNNNEDQK